VRAFARLVAVVGAVLVGALLLRAAPKDMVLVYGLPAAAEARSLEVDIRLGDELVRHAEFRVAPDRREVRHPVRLPRGEYALAWHLGALAGERPLSVEDGGTVVLPLGR
jgi:hypothetical protein